MTPDELRQKIKEAQDRQNEGKPHKAASSSKGRADSIAFRAATDLVSGVAVGAFVGYWIDRWLGSQPFGMIILLFLGFIAGFMNIYRSQTAPSSKKDAGETTNKGS
jgi:ATP synthase protein I